MSAPQPESLPIRPRDDTREEQEVEGGYSHDATVAAITSLFAYVSELYGEDYPLSYPPPGGWEAINRDNLVKLQEHGKYMNGLTDRVLSLMRHIPYFRLANPELMFFTHAADHLQSFTGSLLNSPETDAEKEAAEKSKAISVATYEEHLPPHFMVLTTGHQWRCYCILIDTEIGAVRFWDRYDGSEFPTQVLGDLGWEDDVDEVDEDGPESWKLAPIYRISTFFDLWRKEFLDWNKELMYREDNEEENRSEDEDKEEEEVKGGAVDDQSVED